MKIIIYTIGYLFIGCIVAGYQADDNTEPPEIMLYITFWPIMLETDETYMVSVVDLKESKNTDTQLIQEVKRGKDGVSVKLADKQKAIDWLSKYFLVHPDDKYKAEFDKKRAEVSDDSGAQILQNMQTIADILQHPVANRSISDLEEGDADE